MGEHEKRYRCGGPSMSEIRKQRREATLLWRRSLQRNKSHRRQP